MLDYASTCRETCPDAVSRKRGRLLTELDWLKRHTPRGPYWELCAKVFAAQVKPRYLASFSFGDEPPAPEYDVRDRAEVEALYEVCAAGGHLETFYAAWAQAELNLDRECHY